MKEQSCWCTNLQAFSMCIYCAFVSVHTCRQLFMSSPHSEQNDKRETDYFLFFHLIRWSSAASESTLVVPNSVLGTSKATKSTCSCPHVNHTNTWPHTHVSIHLSHMCAYLSCTHTRTHKPSFISLFFLHKGASRLSDCHTAHYAQMCITIKHREH